ncbi:MAG: protein-disulfide reductase DsbD family protein [Solirubrobacterales bacterium]
MKGTKGVLAFVVCAALGAAAFAQGGVASEATEIVQFELQQSSASLTPARLDGRPGVAVVFKGTEDLHYYARPETAPSPGMELQITATSDRLKFDRAVFPTWTLFTDATGQQVEVYVGDFTAFIPIREESLSADAKTVTITVQVTGIACTSVLCLPPFDKTLTANLNLADLAAWPTVSIGTPRVEPPAADKVVQPRIAPASASPAQETAKPSSALTYYLLAVVAGLSINIMPCVLPVLPLILLRLVDQSRGPGGKRISSGLAFCVGVILFFAAFALVSAIVNLTTGAVLDLNSLFRYPAAVIVLFLAIVFFGLAMLDIVTLTLPSSIAGRQSNASGLAGSAGMGFFAGVLSTPCSGALLGFVLVWAQTQPLAVSSTAIVLMGVGMALPYAVIVLIPSLLDQIPKPGYWMEIFKKSAGFLLFLIAAKLTLAALPKDRLLNVLMYGVIFSFCVWMWGKWVDFSTPVLRRWIIRLIAVSLAVGTGMWLLPASASSAAATAAWKPYDAEVIQQAVAKRQPVLLKFTADWCTNCKVVERRVYQDPEVVGLIRTKNVLPIKADTTSIDYPATRDLKAVYGEAGNVPVTVLLLPDGTHEKLRGIFDKSRVIPILSNLPEARK